MRTALLDFTGALRSEHAILYPRTGRPGSWIALPHTLAIGQLADGTPDLHLEMVRARRSDDGTLVGYGYIDFRAVAAMDLDAARTAVPGAEVSGGTFGGGWLRLAARSADIDRSTVLLPPVRITSNGLGAVRLAARLDAESASLFRQALLGGVLLVDAWAEMEVSGTPPRVPAVVTLQTSALDAALNPGRDRLVTRASVVDALTSSGLLDGLRSGIAPALAAEAVADRLRALYATHAPSPDERQITEWWQLDLPPDDTHLRLDLSEAVTAVRMTALHFDPAAQVRDMLAGGVERVIRERELPELQTGFVPVLVSANLPEERSPVLSCGADLAAPPLPPDRPQEIRETVELLPPSDRADTLLRFSPRETPAYTCQAFIVLATQAGITELWADARPHSGEIVRLTMSDFPVTWIPVAASAPLVREGLVTVTATWQNEAQSVMLTATQRRDSLAVPSDAGAIEVAVTLTRDGRSLHAVVPPGEETHLDLSLYPGYGPHTLELTVDFEEGNGVLAIELKPEAEADSAAVTLAFSPSNPSRTWRWFAGSPFTPGYRYRLFRSDAPLPWSEPQPPAGSLRISAKALTAGIAEART